MKSITRAIIQTIDNLLHKKFELWKDIMKFGFIRFLNDILCIQNKVVSLTWILLKGRFIIRNLLSISALLHLTGES